MKKVLFISNIADAKMSVSFCGGAMYSAKALDMEFISVANRDASSAEQIKLDEETYSIRLLHADISRSPFSFKNIKAYRQIKSVIKKEHIEYIHCNTPVGGVIGRLAGKSCGVKRVLYQAHGFHFYKGAPKINWLVYYPVEKLLARLTDAIVTINKEDFELAKNKMKLRNGGKVYYVPGVGIDVAAYGMDEEKRQGKRAELGLDDNDIVLVSLGDLIERKNYRTAIRAVAAANNKNVKYIICGKGPEEESLKSLAMELGLESQVLFLGFRTDVKELLEAADIFLFTTKQEGLPRSMMEAMASGLPCVVSRIRGNTDLLEGEKGGFLCDSSDEKAFADAISKLADSKTLREEMGKSNLETIKNFSFDTVKDIMLDIYKSEFTEQENINA